MSARRFEDLFRKAYEGYASFCWAFGAIIALMYRPPWWYLMVPALLIFALIRAKQVQKLWKFRLSLSLSRMRTITLPALMSRSRKQRKRGMLSLGRGFVWSQKHAEIANQILNRNVDELPDLPQFVRNAMQEIDAKPKAERTRLDEIKAGAIKAILPPNTKPVMDSDIGSPWIHGIGIAEEVEIGIPFTSLPGHTLITGTTRAGKAQPLDSLVHTPQGWVRMGSIQPGMRVSTPDGGSAVVLHVFPQGHLPIYQVTLEDGRSVKACGEHLWEVHHKHWSGKYHPGVSRSGAARPRIMSTLEIKEKLARNSGAFKLRTPEAVQKPKQELAIPPYVLGCLLGDGLIGVGNRLFFCNTDEDIIENIRRRLPPVMCLKHIGPRPMDYSFQVADQDLLRKTQLRLVPGRRKNPFRAAVEEMGISGCRSWEKHIPAIYKESNIEDRYEILRGLMDTDGTVSKNGAVYFNTSSEQLAKDVQEIVCSLGGFAKITTKKTTFTTARGEKKQGRLSYNLSIRHPYPKMLFHSSRKRARAPNEYRFGASNMRVKITKIEQCGIELAQCIAIDHPDHLYITDGYVVTHNTRLYEMITAQIVDMGSALIVIDPKKDIDWVSMLKLQCRKANRKFLYFDPAQPAKSIRLQPLQNWNNKSEPATRIGQLVDADGSFAAFAWKTLYRVHRGLIAAGERPTIRNTKRYVQMGVEGLAEKILTIHFAQKHGADWDRDLRNLPKDGKNAMTRLDWCMAKYIDEGESDDTIEGIISMVKHSKEHYSKMVQVLEPILEMLGSDELGDLLSPDHQDLTDTRPIYDMRRVIDEKAVLYIGLDSLSNKIIASAIGSILLADLSSTLGAIYNFSTPTDAYLFVDEVAEVANDQLIQILNKGGGAGIKSFLAMQSIADLTVRLNSKDKCEQVLANLNNIISLRIRSAETAKYVSELFGEVNTRSLEVSYSSGSESSSAFTEFRSNTSRSLKSEKSALIPTALLTRLPPLHYFAFLAGRGIYKGVLEFIEADREAP